MIIAGLGGVPQPAAAARTKATGFSVPTPQDRSAATTATAAPAPLDAMLALQEQGGDLVRDRQARRHGQALLQALAALQHALLSDAAPTGPLQHLAALAAACPDAADPRLNAVVQALSLRAQVELARRDLPAAAG